MTGPVTKDDLVTGLVKFLLTKPDVLAVVGTKPVTGEPCLFAYSNWVVMEKSQSTSAFVTSDGGWAAPNIHNTLRFPRVALNIWVDPMRDAGGNVTDPAEAMRRIDAAFQVFDRYLHRPDGESQMWGTVRTVASVRLTDPFVTRLSDGDGLVRLLANYAVTQG